MIRSVDIYGPEYGRPGRAEPVEAFSDYPQCLLCLLDVGECDGLCLECAGASR